MLAERVWAHFGVMCFLVKNALVSGTQQTPWPHQILIASYQGLIDSQPPSAPFRVSAEVDDSDVLYREVRPACSADLSWYMP